MTPATEPLSSDLASPLRRAAALGVDLLVLFAGLIGAVTLGAALSLELTMWFALAWWIVVAPLYFAFYHGRSTAQTPGEREAGVALRDAKTGACIGIPRSLLRACAALLGTILVLPVVLDAVALVVGRSRRSPRDRLTGATAIPLAREQRVPQLRPTAAAAEPVFQPVDRRHRRQRLAAIASPYRRSFFTAALAVYLGLIVLAVVMAPLLIEDAGLDVDAAWLAGWYTLGIVLFVSGVYWTEAAIVVAVEAARVGDPPPSPLAIVRQAAGRVNALSIALVFVLALAAVSLVTFYAMLLVLARFAFVVPVLELEDRSVLGAFRRSWHLTAGRTWRTLGQAAGSALLVGLTLGVTLAVANGLVAAATTNAGAAVFVGASAVALLVAAVPISLLLVWVGTDWSLLYYDLRSRRPASGR